MNTRAANSSSKIRDRLPARISNANFEKSFAAYQDYDSNLSLDSVEAQLVDEIVEILVEDIFNATVANW